MRLQWSLKLCFLLVLGFLCVSNSSNISRARRVCDGSVAECNLEELEELMATETSRRFLEQTKYISPGALNKNKPACNGGPSGQSYSSSCLPPPANHESRGCSKIYRCRSDG